MLPHHFAENSAALTKSVRDPRGLGALSYDTLYEAMVQNDDFQQGYMLGQFLFEKFNLDVEAHDTSKEIPSDNADPRALDDVLKAHDDTINSIYAMNKTKLLLQRQTYAYAEALQFGNREKRKESLKEIKNLLTPFFSEELKPEPEPPKKKPGLFSFFRA